jgi:hypothetical protein
MDHLTLKFQQLYLPAFQQLTKHILLKEYVNYSTEKFI